MSTISLFGWLEKFPLWRNLPYPTKSSILRAAKAGLSVAVAILLTAATQGILFPATVSPMIVLIITSILQAVDKFLRETQVEKEANANPIPLTDNPTGE